MTEMVNVEGTELAVREYNGQRVVTFRDIDNAHQRPAGTAYRNFRQNKKYFSEGKDYIVVKPDFKTYEIRLSGITPNKKGTTLITERGYLKVVKSFNDDLSWKVQDALVDAYFVVKNQQPTAAIEEKHYFPEDTDWFRTNEWKIRYYCEYVGITKKVFMHLLLKVIGRKYYFDGARKRYIEETGNLKPTNSEVISYFDNIREEADKCLNNAYNVALNGEHKEKDPD